MVPAGRVYTVQVHSPPRPRRVRLESGRELPEGPGEGQPGWWHGDQCFTFVRLQSHPAAVDIEW